MFFFYFVLSDVSFFFDVSRISVQCVQNMGSAVRRLEKGFALRSSRMSCSCFLIGFL